VNLDVGSASAAPVVDARVTLPFDAHAVPSLLPEPGAGALDGTQDALAMLYTLVAHQGEMSMAIGESAVAIAQREQSTQLQEEKAAEIAEEQAEASQGGFWHDLLSIAEDVAKVAGILVGVAAVAAASVCTGGAAGVAIVATAATLISAGAIVSATHCLGKFSDYFALGAEIVGSALTLGATSGAVASSALADAAHTVGTAAQVTQGAASIAGGVASIELGHFQSEGEDAAADVQQALNSMNRESRLVDDIITGLQASQQSNKNALKLVAGVAHTYGETMSFAGSLGKA
jgi:hypothetical protein